MKNNSILILVCCTAALCATQYTASTGSVALSGIGMAATLQQPAGANAIVSFPSDSADVQCSVPCIATVSSASGSSGSVSSNPGIIAPGSPSVQFFTASHPSGETILGSYPVSGSASIDLSAQTIAATPGARITITVSAITGTASITFHPIQ